MLHKIAALAAWLYGLAPLATEEKDSLARMLRENLNLPPEIAASKNEIIDLALGKGTGACQEALDKALKLLGPKNPKTPKFLENVFSKVKLGGKDIKPGTAPRYYSLARLDGGDLFPQEKPRDESRQLAADFWKALSSLPRDMGLGVYFSSLASITERYAWSLPSPLQPEASVFDACMVLSALTQSYMGSPDGHFLLLGADLSGIQNFIFGREGQADKNANKLLRARSFLLQTFTRSFWLTVLDKTDYLPCARIMDAGGRFVLLLPDNDDVQEAIADLRKKAQNWLIREFNATVRMTFQIMPLAAEDLGVERFQASHEKFNDLLEEAKLKPLQSEFDAGQKAVLDVDHSAYAKFGECVHCHARPAASENGACELCRQLIVNIGAKLPKAKYLVFSRGANGAQLFDGIGIDLLPNAPDAAQAREALDVISMRDYSRFSAVPIAGHMPVITPENMERWESAGLLAHVNGETLFDGEECRPEMPKTFAMIAEMAQEPQSGGWRSIPCLAVCKADVDNLGLLFGMGLSEGGFTLARFAMLARMLNFFFSWRLMRVVEEEFPDIYVIFAGGDDLFVLGPWNRIFAFAERLSRDFAAFTGHNPAVTISAGLPLIKPDLPMRALYNEAEDYLEKSKDNRGDALECAKGDKKPPVKNSATAFGVTATWPLFSDLLQKGQWLEQLALDKKITQGLLRRMLEYSRQCKKFNCEGDIRAGLYLSHFRYDLARNMAVSDSNDEESRQMREMRDELLKMGQNKDTFPKADIGISYALYRTRTS